MAGRAGRWPNGTAQQAILHAERVRCGWGIIDGLCNVVVVVVVVQQPLGGGVS